MHGWYAAARVAGTKGLEGKLRLINASAFLRSAAAGDEAAFVPPREDAPRFSRIDAWEQTSDEGCLVSFSDVASADAAEMLVGSLVLLQGDAAEALPPEEGLGWLCGFTVEDGSLGPVGIVDSVDAGPGRFQPLLHVKREGRDDPALIPFAEELVTAIDEDGQRICMDLPAGILDL